MIVPAAQLSLVRIGALSSSFCCVVEEEGEGVRRGGEGRGEGGGGEEVRGGEGRGKGR